MGYREASGLWLKPIGFMLLLYRPASTRLESWTRAMNGEMILWEAEQVEEENFLYNLASAECDTKKDYKPKMGDTNISEWIFSFADESWA